MSKISVCVEVDDKHVDDVRGVAQRLGLAGMKVEQISERAGAIFGSADDTLLASLRTVEGVHSAGKDEEFQLPPPNSDKPQ
ncbi:MAG: hypothetical protein ACR2OV_06790 [Hyphomicrobiaceae bacterium]